MGYRHRMINKKQKNKRKYKMNITKTVLGVLFASALFTVTALGADVTAPTGKDLGQWTLSLGGSGAVATETRANFAGGAEIDLGHTGDLILPLEFGVRQTVGYVSNGDLWSLSTHVYNDWTLIKLGSLEFDLGANVGLTYGNTPLAWTLAPEAVQRVWLLNNVNAFLREEFPFNLKDNGVKAQNSLALTLGIQVRF